LHAEPTAVAPVSTLQRLVDGYFQLLKATIALCLALMVLLVLGNVILRYAFNSGLTLTEELSRWLFVYLVFLGAVVALREHAHLGVDSLLRRLSPPLRRACLVLSHLLMLWATWLLLKGSWVQTLINLETTAPSSGLPVGVVYAAGIVYGASAGPILLWELWRILRTPLGEGDLPLVRGHEEASPIAAPKPPDRKHG